MKRTTFIKGLLIAMALHMTGCLTIPPEMQKSVWDTGHKDYWTQTTSSAYTPQAAVPPTVVQVLPNGQVAYGYGDSNMKTTTHRIDPNTKLINIEGHTYKILPNGTAKLQR